MRPRPRRSAPASSPAPAMPAASSRPPTPSGTPPRSRDWCETRVSSSTGRSTSTSPAAITPARSTTSAISACSPRKVADRGRGRHVEGYHIFVGGGFGPDAGARRARSITTSRPRMRRGPSSALLRAYLAHRASPDETFLAFARRHDGRSAAQACPTRRRRMNQLAPPPGSMLIPENAPFSRRAARLAERLLRRPARRSTAATPLSPEQERAR